MPKVSVLIATYNRKKLLLRAVESVLKQDFEDYELVIYNDCSTDGTDEVVEFLKTLDPRIKSVKPDKNVGSVSGDRLILREFVYNISKGQYLIYLCDDDFWIPSNLLSRAVRILDENADIVQVAGGQVQVFDQPIDVVPNINSFWVYQEYKDISGALYMKGIYPNGKMTVEDFLNYQSEDPVMRNILTGASIFRKKAMISAGVLSSKLGAKWQAGYELTTGIGTQGQTYYFDEPSIAAGVDLNSASFRGTQLLHLLDCIESIKIAFRRPILSASSEKQSMLKQIKTKMIHSVMMNYLRNKIGFKLGYFGTPYLPDIKRIFIPEISVFNFLKITLFYKLKISLHNLVLILCSGFPIKPFKVLRLYFEKKYGPDWLNILSRVR